MDEKIEFQVIVNCSYTPDSKFALNHEEIEKRTREAVDYALYESYNEIGEGHGYSFTVYDKPYSESAKFLHVDMIVKDEDSNKIM